MTRCPAHGIRIQLSPSGAVNQIGAPLNQIVVGHGPVPLGGDTLDQLDQLSLELLQTAQLLIARGSIEKTASGAAKFIAQVSLFSQSLGVAIAQTTYATDASGEINALRQQLAAVELEGGAGAGGRAACQPPFSLCLAQRGADFLIAVKQSRPKGFRLIRDRLPYCRRIPWRTSKREVKRGRDITWTMRAMPAWEWVVEQWPGSATIIPVR